MAQGYCITYADVNSDGFKYRATARLNLDTEIRFHQAKCLHDYVEGLLGDVDAPILRRTGDRLEEEGYHLRITRDLDEAKQYLRERYSEQPDARFGIIASSKDRDLYRFGVKNDFQATKQVKYGPWYTDNEDEPGGYSCRNLDAVVTEFGAQGLELDAALIAWGTDWMWTGRQWSNGNARGYKNLSRIRSARQLRLNAYRFLLTRGRDASVVFMPKLPMLDQANCVRV